MPPSMISSIPGGGSGKSKSNEIDFMPLYMSFIAGMSTCLGAVWVLLQRRPSSSSSSLNSNNNNNRLRLEPVIPPSTMCFSLALAGSVMVTVSVVSIIPECLREEEEEAITLLAGTQLQEVDHDGIAYKMIPLWSWTFLYRLSFHVLGYLLYYLLAKFAFPEPDEILGFTNHPPQKYSTIAMNEIDWHDDEEEMRGLSPESNLSAEEPKGKVTTTKEGDAPATSTTILHSEQNDHHKQHTTTATATKKPETTTTRNRRGVERVASSSGAASVAERMSLLELQRKPSSMSGDSNHDNKPNNDDNNNDEEVKIKPDFFRSLSRYSSGADLESHESKRAWRVAMLLFVSLSVHNFPEGLAVAASAMESRKLGIKVTIGIMVHNIPEGVSIAVPCLAARPDSPWLAFWLSALSGLAEPFGAFCALFFLRDIEQRQQQKEVPPKLLNMENVLAFVAGIMIMVAVAELFPEALRHTKDGKFHFVAGTVCGIVLMVATELYLA